MCSRIPPTVIIQTSSGRRATLGAALEEKFDPRSHELPGELLAVVGFGGGG